MTHSDGLHYEVFVSEPVPLHGEELIPNGEKPMFSPLAATLIHGQKQAVLVDPPITTQQAEAVGDWIVARGVELTYIYVTHGHGDHWFGASVLARRFPGVEVLATAGTIQMMRIQGSAEYRALLWDKWLPGQVPDTQVLATAPRDNTFEIEGHTFRAIEVGHSDTDDTTVLHVPSIGLVVAGDVIYNGVHQFLTESAGDGIRSWLSAIDTVENLAPRWIVASHKDKLLDDTAPRVLAETRRYLLDADRLLKTETTDLGFFTAMLELYPDRLNPGALWTGARFLYQGR
ncbi:MBL fold metallo-hydrolase [Streptomyces variegatus]|uniref:MBL fold metallo-hydrolase n=1 Tax=Streptomyces variegatus TaxID=284040 RepID=UPI003C308691